MAKKNFFVFFISTLCCLIIYLFLFININWIEFKEELIETIKEDPPHSIKVLIYDCVGARRTENLEYSLYICNNEGLVPGFSFLYTRKYFTEENPLNYQTLKDYDVLFISGGYLNQMYQSWVREDIRRWVSEGGGYVGICAGEILAIEGEVEDSIFGDFYGLEIAPNIKRVTTNWVGARNIRMTELGTELLGFSGDIGMFEWNGSALGYKQRPVKEYIFAKFYGNTPDRESEVFGGTVWDNSFDSSAAIIGDYFVKGRVLLCSPHPEHILGGGMYYRPAFVAAMIKWAYQDDSSVPITVGRDHKLIERYQTSSLSAISCEITADVKLELIKLFTTGVNGRGMVGIYAFNEQGEPGSLISQSDPFTVYEYFNFYEVSLIKEASLQRGEKILLAWIFQDTAELTSDTGIFEGDIGDSRLYVTGFTWGDLIDKNKLPEYFPQDFTQEHQIVGIQATGN